MHLVCLGKVGAWLQRALDGGFQVIVKSSDDDSLERCRLLGCQTIEQLQDLWQRLEPPRIYLIDATTGPTVDALIDESYVFMEPGDCVLDATVSYWGDTLRRYRRMRHRAIYYIDIALLPTDGTAALLAAGEPRAMTLAAQTLSKLASPGKLVPAGEASSAHFAACVADSVLTARALIASEARQLLEAFPQPTDHAQLLQIMNHVVGDPAGRQAWLGDDAFNLEAPIPVLLQALMSQLTDALDQHSSRTALPKVGTFVHPKEIL